MESMSNTIICSKDCDMDDNTSIKEDFNQDKISTKSQKHNSLQNETHFGDCVCSNDADTKAGIKQETWSPNAVSSDTLVLEPLKGMDAKEVGDAIDSNEHFNEKEIFSQSQMHHLVQNETHYMECVERSLENSKIIKQVTWGHINMVSSGIKEDAEEPDRLLGTGTIKDDMLDIKEEHWWCVGTSVDTHSGEKESIAQKSKISEETLPLETPRLPTNAILHNGNSVTFLVIEEEGTSPKQGCTKNNSQRASMGQNIMPNCSTTYSSPHFESKHHMDENTLVDKCKVFENCYTWKSSLKKHTPYKCDMCKKCFTCKSNLERHVVLHLGPKLYKCDICEKCFRWKYLLRKHMLLHSGTRPYKCDICAKCFLWKYHLQRHKMIHSGTKPFKCDMCLKCFIRQSDLQSHILVHSSTKPHKCDLCEMSFKRNSELLRHIELHSGTKSYKCDICAKCFPHKTSLKVHTLLHSGIKPFKCDICEKSFTKKSSLPNHMLLHSGSKPFKCDMCEKSFRENSHLKSHMLLHTDKKLYKCYICEKCFKGKQHLKRHLFRHSGIKPFKCNICEKSFKQNWHLKRHMLLHSDK